VSAIKKTLVHPKADESARGQFQDKIELCEKLGRTIIYIDESGFAHDMPRTHGYAPIGQRCYGTHDWHAKGRTNVIGALCGGSLLTVSLFDSTINADVFHAWLCHDLLPKLPAHCGLVLDNASFHKRSDIQQAIEQAEHTLAYLPPYPPDLNPIEHKWAQAKAVRRQHQCEIEDLFDVFVA